MDIDHDSITISWQLLIVIISGVVAGVAYIARIEVHQHWIRKNITALWNKIDPKDGSDSD